MAFRLFAPNPGVVGVALLVLAPDPAQCRQRWLDVGARARVTSAGQLVQGTVVARDDETAWLAVDQTADTVSITIGSITHLQVEGTRSNVGVGAAVGLTIGALFGGFLGAATFEEPGPCEGLCIRLGPENTAQAFVLGAFVGGALGAGLGAIAGSQTKRPYWRTVLVSLAADPRGRAFAVVLSVPWE